MEIYIVRHGETLWNREKRLQGNADIELSDYGRWLAEESASHMTGIHFDKVFSSPLKRAYETACIMCPSMKDRIITDPRLKELNFGIYEGQTVEALNQDPNGFFRYFFDAPQCYKAPPQGESLEHLCSRAADFMINEIEPIRNDCERIMIVAHGAMNKALMMHVNKQYDIRHFWDGNLQRNCGVIILSCTDNGYQILEHSHLFYDLDIAKQRKTDFQ